MTTEQEQKLPVDCVEVEYIESGAFQGSEEAVYRAKFKSGQELVVITKERFIELLEAEKFNELRSRSFCL